ncbi:hypothetical protein GF377_01470, partial [candidate division GN15 bacterium]|nr:hypothetical protein [candidate division GN15 bacterium]
MSNEQHSQDEQHTGGYEKRDANIVSLSAIVVVSVVVVAVAIVFLYDYFIATREAVVHEQQLAPVSEELEQLRAEQREILE